MKMYKDEFDSTLFGHDVYKIHLDASSKEEQLELTLPSPSTVFCFAPVIPELTTLLEQHDYHFISIRHTYRYGGSMVSLPAQNTDISIVPFTQDQQLKESDLHTLAITVGEETRYFKDKNIPRAISENLYDTWVKNSLYKNFASRCFIAWYQDKPIGICTTKIRREEGEIDLLGVVSEFRSKKVGKQLVEHALHYLQTNNTTHISVVTSGENLPANIFFQKNNFYIDKVDLVYHKHLKASTL